MRGKQAQAGRNFQAVANGHLLVIRHTTDHQRSTRAGVIVSFCRGELGWLQFGDAPRGQITRQDLQRDADATQSRSDAESGAMEFTFGTTQQEERVNPSNEESRSYECRKCHMYHFVKGSRAEHGGDRINLCKLAVSILETRRSVHPRVGRDNEDAGGNSADRNQDPGKPMSQWRKFSPAIKEKTEKDRFRKESEAFQREGHPDD